MQVLKINTKKAPNSGAFKWCRVSESNQGHRDFQSLALPTELTRHSLFDYTLSYQLKTFSQ